MRFLLNFLHIKSVLILRIHEVCCSLFHKSLTGWCVSEQCGRQVLPERVRRLRADRLHAHSRHLIGSVDHLLQGHVAIMSHVKCQRSNKAVSGTLGRKKQYYNNALLNSICNSDSPAVRCPPLLNTLIT